MTRCFDNLRNPIWFVFQNPQLLFNFSRNLWDVPTTRDIQRGVVSCLLYNKQLPLLLLLLNDTCWLSSSFLLLFFYSILSRRWAQIFFSVQRLPLPVGGTGHQYPAHPTYLPVTKPKIKKWKHMFCRLYNNSSRTVKNKKRKGFLCVRSRMPPVCP